MEAFYFTVAKELHLMVVPEPRVYLDGHPVLTHSYSIYKNIGSDEPLETLVNTESGLPKGSNPDYLGFVTFEIPGKLFNYVADGAESLSRDELEQVVEQISHYRDNPELWKFSQN